MGPTGGRVEEIPTVAELEAVPPMPLQVRVYVVCLVIGPIDELPDGGSVPLQPPEAVQPSAPVEDQINVSAPACATTAEEARNDTVGSAGGTTVRDTEALVEPPAPVHVIEKGPESSNPVSANVPIGGKLPDIQRAVHAVAFEEDHVRVADPPYCTVDGLIENETTGLAGGP